MNKVALVIIYNHQYNKNIETLEGIYRKRFSHIYHLVPFYDGAKSNVIPVYDNSHYFQGYIAQGLKSYFKEEYAHYFFIADDLMLNPVVDESNYSEHLKLKPKSCFLPGFISLHKCNSWHRVPDAYNYSLEVRGVEATSQLPTYNIALSKFKNFGLEIKPLIYSQIFIKPVVTNDWLNKIKRGRYFLARCLSELFLKKRYKLLYPAVGSYSDIFVVSSDAIKQFCHYCGVFSATKLHVEVAIPTSLVLAAEEIVTEKDLVLQGRALWTQDDYSILEKYGFNLNKLFRKFPENYLYLHPVKLSKWSMK